MPSTRADWNTGAVEGLARECCRNLTESYSTKYGSGSMTCNAYDTAWVACVSKTVGNRPQWLFPSCFYYLLRTQEPQGGWHSFNSQNGARCDDDAILSTAAAIHALLQYLKTPYQLDVHHIDLSNRISKAVAFLESKLSSWRLHSRIGVGFEILLPALLDLLEKSDIKLSFESKDDLYQLREHKLAKIDLDMIYKNEGSSTVLHSVEAWYGDGSFDYNKLARRKVNGSMLASPSATAAYLMRILEWDPEAEAYLHLVVSRGLEKDGGVPSAWPSSVFEMTWVMSTLLQVGLNTDTLSWQICEDVLRVLKSAGEGQDGLIGFTLGAEVDLDDSSRASIIHSLSGKSGLSAPIIATFSAPAHFRTYQEERHPSFTANCNALEALLLDQPIHTQSVEKVARYLCLEWWKSRGAPEDKWNASPLYVSMLMAQCFTRLLENSTEGRSSWLPKPSLREDVLLAVLQCTVRVLQSQNTDGSWNKSREETSYAVICLVSLSAVPLLDYLRQRILSAIGQGRAYIAQHYHDEDAQSLWIEKIRYGSKVLSKSYAIAAMYAAETTAYSGANEITEESAIDQLKLLYDLPIEQIPAFLQMTGHMPLFKSCPQWILISSWIEGRLFLPKLGDIRNKLFRREHFSKDEYIDFIPFTWTAANNLKGSRLSSAFLFDMMAVSVLNFQADEYMESTVAQEFSNHLDDFGPILDEIFSTFDGEGGSQEASNCVKLVNTTSVESLPAASNNLENGEASSVSSVKETIKAFADSVIYHPRVKYISQRERAYLVKKLKRYFMAHYQQNEDNRVFSQQKIMVNGHFKEKGLEPIVFTGASDPFYDWVENIGAQHTSCPYSWTFASCLARAERPGNYASNAQQSYLAADICRHLAAMCRMYNDYGSVARDRQEWNLNSVNFPEFQVTKGASTSQGATSQDRLLRLAEYERACLTLAMAELEKEVDDLEADWIKVFVTVTDMFGQIYVVRDIASQRI